VVPHATSTYANTNSIVYNGVRVDLIKLLTAFAAGTIHGLHGMVLVLKEQATLVWG
jgi:hypothetical protein